MVTLVSDIIRDAYRESNLISIGTEPSGAQQLEGLRFINRLVPSVLSYEAGEALTSEYLDGDSSVFVSNIRLVLDEEHPTSLTLPHTQDDGTRFGILDPSGSLAAVPLTISGGPNTIEGQKSVTLFTPGVSVEYFFRADTGNWQKTGPLVQTEQWPFPPEFDDMFIITLAFRLNPRYNITSQSESLMMLKRSERQFRARYKQSKEMPSDLALVNLSNAPTYGFNSFDRGTM